MRPTALAFDLDPGPPADIVTCCEVGQWLKATFDALGTECFAKTSGSKGLQVYVPLNTPVTYKRTKAFAHALAGFLERQFPETVVSKMQKSLRTGKVLVDWSQNDDHKTTVNVYSLRAKQQRPTVSTPVTWDEVARTLKKGDSALLTFDSLAMAKLPSRQSALPVQSDNSCFLLRAKAPTSPPGLFILDFHLRDYPKSRRPSHSWLCLHLPTRILLI